MKNSYHTVCKPIDKITIKEREEIIALYLNYYDGSDSAQVTSDLNNKTEIIIMTFNKKIVGFTTLEFYEKKWHKKTIRIVYSGDTIVAREHWGQQSLTFACITRMGVYKQEKPDLSLYWFIIVKGHRTYKYLPVFVNLFYPHWDYQCESIKAIAEFLAVEKFAEIYNSQTGVLEFPESKGHWDLVHHNYPHARWQQLPEMGKNSRLPIPYWPQYFRQWLGPRANKEPAPMAMKDIY